MTGFALAITNVFDVEIATRSAYTAGLPPDASATLIAIGTIITVAPTLETTCENSSARIAMTACNPHCGHSPR
jgi:hypothetical protein